MSKGMDQKKNEKKQPTRTLKEKRAAKQEKNTRGAAPAGARHAPAVPPAPPPEPAWPLPGSPRTQGPSHILARPDPATRTPECFSGGFH